VSGPCWKGDIEELIRKLAEVESEIANSTSNQADSVLDPVTSMPILLRHAQTALLRANDELETQVKHRTAELVKVNQELLTEVNSRKIAEKALQDAHSGLERKVRERTAEMERFIYTVSHDLRSPLVTVSGFVGLLEEDLEKGNIHQAFSDLSTIREAIIKMDRLLMDTLELSRIGRVINAPKDVPFDQIVLEALEQTANRIKSGNVTVSVVQDLPKIRVDMPRIVEVLVNLIENSVKYMGDQERPNIEIGFRKERKETIFFIKDNGIGIDPKEHEKIFGLFYKLDRNSEGTGAGLGIVKRIIEVHGGRVWIESEPGKGCTVCFTLPLTDGTWPPLDRLNSGRS
jgi:signal transduction histidine kinase